MDGYDFDRAKGVTEVLFFSHEPAPTGHTAFKPEIAQALAKVRAETGQRGMRLSLCIGGWGRSAGFVAMSTSPQARAVFITEISRLCRQYHLDSIDLDWEHPATDAENANAAQLATELAAALDPLQIDLTAAVDDWQPLPKPFFDALDRVHLMAYDADGKHSTFDGAKASVDKVIARAVAPGKIVLGLPLYGRRFAPPRDAVSIGELLAKHAPADGVDEIAGYYFNSGQTLAAKVRWARDRGLSGVMVWELGHDAIGPAALLPRIVAETQR